MYDVFQTYIDDIPSGSEKLFSFAGPTGGGDVLNYPVIQECVTMLRGFLARKFREWDALSWKTLGLGFNLWYIVWECPGLG